VVTTIRLYYDATIAVALTIVFSIVVALIAGVIVGDNGPNVFAAIIVFVLTGLILLFRLQRSWPKSSETSTGLTLTRWR
jgi:hypothetical protein